MDLAILTLNCAKARQPGKSFAGLVASALPAEPPKMFVVGLQEVAPIINASFKNLDEFMEPIRRAIGSTLAKKFDGTPYGLVADSWSGAIGVMVYAQRSESVHGVKTAATSFGRLWSSLKAAAAVRLEIEQTTFTFVTAHLAANEGFVAARNRDYAILANGLRFGTEPLYVFSPNHHLFVFGDLNYRTIRSRAGDSPENEAMLTHYDPDKDELAVEKAAGRTLWGLHEAPVEFPPTFKFEMGSDNYNLKRTPSWCDRVLFSDANAQVLAYASAKYAGSDHKPVYLHVKVSESAPLEVQVAPASFVTTSVSDASDKVLGGALYLGTTRTGWVVLVLLVLLGLYIVT